MKITKTLMLFTALLLPDVVLSQSVEVRKLPAFTSIQSGGSFDTYIEQGNEESVRIEAGALDTRKIITEVEGGNLKVYLEKGNYNNIRTKVFITYKNLSAVSHAGSGKMECRSDLSAGSFKLRSTGSGGLEVKGSIKADELEIMIGGSGNTQVGAVDAQQLKVGVSGSGTLSIQSGNTSNQQVAVSGSGGFKGLGVKSDTATVSVSGSGSADITVNESFNATVNGSGGINYKGEAQVTNMKTSGSGRIRKI